MGVHTINQGHGADNAAELKIATIDLHPKLLLDGGDFVVRRNIPARVDIEFATELRRPVAVLNILCARHDEPRPRLPYAKCVHLQKV